MGSCENMASRIINIILNFCCVIMR